MARPFVEALWDPDSFIYSCFKSTGAPGPTRSLVRPRLSPLQLGQPAEVHPAGKQLREPHRLMERATRSNRRQHGSPDRGTLLIPYSFSYSSSQTREPPPDALPSVTSLDALPDQNPRGGCILPGRAPTRAISSNSRGSTTLLVRSGKRYWIPDCFSSHASGPGCRGREHAVGALPRAQLIRGTGEVRPPSIAYSGHIVQWNGDTISEDAPGSLAPGSVRHP